MKTNDALLEKFVQTFSIEPESDDDVIQLQKTDPTALDDMYDKLPARFPPLYEELILSYRWNYPANVRECRLLANPAGADFSGLLAAMMQDKIIFDVCRDNGLILFARGPDISHDPICFDARTGKRRSFRIVRVEHESILINNSIVQHSVLARNFEEFVASIVSG